MDGDSNLADVMIKAKSCHTLQELINTNTVNVKTLGWVERGPG